MALTTAGPTAGDDTVASHVARGDKHLLAEQYDEAEACYRAALEQGTGDVEVAAKLERAATAAATRLADGEAQRDLFEQLFSRERLLGGPDLGPSPEPPPPLGEQREGVAAVAHDASIKLGHAAGAVGSFVLHHLTEFAGRRGTNDAVWTNWHSSGKGLPPRLAKVVQILKLAHMRETLFANNLVRPYPDGAKTAFYGTSTPPPPEALRWRMADGSWNKLTPGPDGRYDPMVGAAYTRFFRNVGDERGLDAVRPRGNEATSPVSVRELSRALFAPTGERQLVPFLNLWAAVWIQFMNNGWVSHGSSDSDRIETVPLAEDDPIRQRYGVDHSRGAAHARGPDPPARRRRAPADVHQRGHPLVGRLAALRQRPPDAGQGAQRRGRQADGHRRRPAPRRPGVGHRAHGLQPQLVGGARCHPHPVRAGAQRDLRHARQRPTRTGATRRCSRPPGS